MEPLPTTLLDAINLHLLDCRSSGFTAKTLHFYRHELGKFQTRCPVCLIDQIEPTHIKQYIVSLQEDGLKDTSVNCAARALRAFFYYCEREGLLATSPMRRVRMPRIAKKILPAYTEQDVHRLLAATADNERNHAIMLVLLDTGLRSAELLNLRGDDIDREGTVHVRQGKGRKDRTVYLGARSQKALLRYFMACGRPVPGETVFRTAAGAPLEESGLRKMLRLAGEAVGVRPCNAHTFRRTYALNCLRNGMNIYVLARLMGHEDIAVLRQYLALVEHDLKASAAKYGVVDNL